jgi:hypothetical protein
MITPSYTEESSEQAIRRFEIECEFVQALANPHYLNCKPVFYALIVFFTDLAQRGYFKEQYFVNYLRYLLYWKRPEYARSVYLPLDNLFFRTLKYPQCLYMLEAVQHADFRDALAVSTNAKYIEDQLLLQWHFYLRKRTRLFVGFLKMGVAR